MGKIDNIYSVWPEWETVEKIGEGSYGKVYKIRNTSDGFVKYSAMKVIEFPQSEYEVQEYQNMGMDYQSVKAYYEDLRENILGEIRVMESLKTGSNIVVIEDYKCVERTEGIGWTIYIRMELLESLNKCLEREKEFSQREVLKIGKDICRALECCEQNHIIHRDIKPDNVFRNPYGSYKLGDFGIAKQLDVTRSVYSQKGTSMYMAPEVAKGEHYNKSVDIYSLGIMLYKLLNHGRFPFMPAYPEIIRPGDAEKAMSKRLDEKQRMLAPVQADAQVAFVIAKATAYHAENRYTSARQMREELERAEYAIYYGKEEGRKEKRSEYKDDSLVIETTTEFEDEKTYMGFDTDSKTKKTEDIKREESKAEETITPVEELKKETDRIQKNRQKPEDIEFHWETEEEKELQEKVGLLREYEHQEKEKKKLKVWTIIMITVPIIASIGVFAFLMITMREKQIQRSQSDMMDFAETFLMGGMYEDAEKVYQDYVEAYPEEEEGYLGLGYLYYEMGNYEKVKEIVEKGKEEIFENRQLNELYNQASCMILLTEARSAVEAGDYESAKNACATAADSYDSSWDMPYWWYRDESEMDEISNDIACDLVDLYLQMQDTGEAERWLTEVQDDTQMEELSIRILEKKDEILAQQQAEHKAKFVPKLTEIYQMMEAGNYSGLLNFFLTEREAMEAPDNALLGGEVSSDIYFQNGDMVGKIESGVGMILSRWGVYVGEIANNQRSGSGKQFGIWSNSAEDNSYTVTTGPWQNNKANGPCTYEVRYLGNLINDYIYTGNVTDNLFNGDITVTWWYDNGAQDSGVAHAENGTWNLIRQEGDKWIFVENSSGSGYVFKTSQEALTGNGVWRRY